MAAWYFFWLVRVIPSAAKARALLGSIRVAFSRTADDVRLISLSGIPHSGNSGMAGDRQKSWPFSQSCYFLFASISPLPDTVHGAHAACAAVIRTHASRLCNKY